MEKLGKCQLIGFESHENCLVVGPFFFRSTERIWRFDLTNHWIQFLSWNLIKKMEASNGKLEKLNSPKKATVKLAKKIGVPGYW